MLGYMNHEALERTIKTREAHYFSRSKGGLWHKGATSGLVQRVIDLRIDDDQDAVWIKVQVQGLEQAAMLVIDRVSTGRLNLMRSSTHQLDWCLRKRKDL